MSYHVIRETAKLPDPRPLVTQGAIVSGLRVPRYDGARHGFLLTARCDLAHIRASLLNFLPVVALREWLGLDGALSILLARIANIEEGVLDQIRSLDEDLLPFFASGDWEGTYASFVQNSPGYAADFKRRLKERIVERAELLHAYRECGHQGVGQVLAVRDKAKELVRKQSPEKAGRVARHQVADVHFLPAITETEDLQACEGYVVLFRQILAVPGALAPYLQAGLDVDEFEREPDLRQLLEPYVRLDGDGVVGIVSNVESPYVEHVLQRFSALFARIGVFDFRRSYLDRIERAFGEM